MSVVGYLQAIMISICIQQCFKHVAAYLCTIPLLLEVAHSWQTMNTVDLGIPLNMKHYFRTMDVFQFLHVVYLAFHVYTYILLCVFLFSSHLRMLDNSWVQTFCLQLLHGPRWTCASIICKIKIPLVLILFQISKYTTFLQKCTLIVLLKLIPEVTLSYIDSL